MFEELDTSAFTSLTQSCDGFLDSLSELSKICCGSYEIEYQQKHKKVKDRYSSTKFYANNFKRNKRRKK